jgi:transcriptional regulator with XRE-family HTH domain
MATQSRKPVAYDTAKLLQDMAKRGWEIKELAAAAEVSHMTVSRFLRSEVQTVKTARRLSRALGRSPGYYLLPTQERVSA